MRRLLDIAGKGGPHTNKCDELQASETKQGEQDSENPNVPQQSLITLQG